ncbi:MAG: hypothetical protein ACOCV2_08925 [Persicimonas sp.]
MDTLDVLEKAERKGGPERRERMTQVIMAARDLGCSYNVGGGKAGGFNIRYGSLRYAVMDLNTRGEVFLHIKHHPSKDITDDQRDEANEFVESIDGFTIKNGPINNYGQIEEEIEDVPIEALEKFLERTVETIREIYYRPHIELAG